MSLRTPASPLFITSAKVQFMLKYKVPLRISTAAAGCPDVDLPVKMLELNSFHWFNHTNSGIISPQIYLGIALVNKS